MACVAASIPEDLDRSHRLQWRERQYPCHPHGLCTHRHRPPHGPTGRRPRHVQTTCACHCERQIGQPPKRNIDFQWPWLLINVRHQRNNRMSMEASGVGGSEIFNLNQRREAPIEQSRLQRTPTKTENTTSTVQHGSTRRHDTYSPCNKVCQCAIPVGTVNADGTSKI